MMRQLLAMAIGVGFLGLTADASAQWKALPDFSTAATCNSIQFLDENSGWVGATGTLLSTADGGQTWKHIAKADLPKSGSWLLALLWTFAKEQYRPAVADEPGLRRGAHKDAV